jgi:hypothetical protein
MSLDYTAPFAAGIALALLATLTLLWLALARVGAKLLGRARGGWGRLRAGALAIGALGGILAWGSARARDATMLQAAVDTVMTTAPRPPRGWRDEVRAPSPYVLLAGDLHCHIRPPDWADHVARGLPDTLALARAEGLDFVSLIPHTFTDFPADARKRRDLVQALAELRASVEALHADDVIFDVGVEYVDPTGHVGLVFGDVPGALAAVPQPLAAARPAAFFDAFADAGGILVIHHPVLTPLHARLPFVSWDISWQPFTGRPPFRPEIAAVDARAEHVEALNLFVSAARDRIALGDAEQSTRAVLARLDREILRRQHRLTPVAGTDSHSFHLRPVLFVLAEQRSHAAVRDALRAGRTCVGAPAACTFEARAQGQDRFLPVGAAFTASRVEVRLDGHANTVLRDGEPVARPARGAVVSVEVPADRCSVLRALSDGGYSAPIYVNCPFAR